MKNYRLAWPLIAVLALVLTLSIADTGLAKERPATAACTAQSPRADGCPDAPRVGSAQVSSTALEQCLRERAAATAPDASRKSACKNARGSACASKYSATPGVRGPRYREMLRRDARCSCNKVSCRLYGRGCANKAC